MRIRAAKRLKLRADEVGFDLRVILPDSWGRQHGEIIAEVPQSLTEPSAQIGQAFIEDQEQAGAYGNGHP